MLLFCIKSMTKLSSLSSSLSAIASGLAMSTALDFNFDSVMVFVVVLMGPFLVNGIVCVVIVSIGIVDKVELLLLFLSSGISFGMTMGAVSHTGLSGGCGIHGDLVIDSSTLIDFVSFICETSLLGDEGVIRSDDLLLLLLVLLVLNDIRDGIGFDIELFVCINGAGGVTGTGKGSGSGKEFLLLILVLELEW